MQFMCFRSSVFPFQPKNETVSQSVTAWKAGKTLDLSEPRLEAIAWAAVYLKCFPVPNATHSSCTFISSTTDCKYNNVSVSNSYYYLLLQHEEILLCQPLRGCIHSYGSGLLLWILRPRCHRKWGRVFCEKLEFSPFFLLEKTQNRSLLFSSFFKKLFQVEGNGAKGNTLRRWPCPICFLSRPSSCLRDKRPKQYPTVEH